MYYVRRLLFVSTHINVSMENFVSLSEKFRRGDLMSAECPSREVLKHMTSRWGILVLVALETDTYRFSQLKRAIGGVSERMLAQTLQWLEADGLVQRTAYQVVPPHVDYRLTPLGVEAAERVRSLTDWIESNLPAIADHWETPKDRADLHA